MTLHRRAFLQVLTAGLAALGWVRPAKAQNGYATKATARAWCGVFGDQPLSKPISEATPEQLATIHRALSEHFGIPVEGSDV